ncbi:hypothetical protein MPL1_05964 [Methylophaga lonarensis MPL]|uniref:DUF4064 domain-containing protein n=1 Tax=Methylophaga lonarensis MPL TaxID=1286106 RepID=M7PHE8_9GAMM|nr:hypothetical protein [Methylophaga lonarensis]EMR13295.1 hypothetical protein MPL1_05964 [Methylophaga lonarensis MPL]
MEVEKHSGLGIASFITSIVSGVFIFLLIAVAGVMEASTPGGLDEESAAAVMIGFFLFAFLVTTLIAFGLGIGGLIQKGRKKIFATLGTVFSAVIFVSTVLLLMVGLMMG